MNEPFRPRDLQRLQGPEELVPGHTVLDFWRWALGDLRMNTARGYLVEFLVAKALGDESAVRVEWGPHDVDASDGTRVEIKTTGYLQSWATKKVSKPSWTFKGVAADQVWSEDLGSYLPADPSTRVHVWIFALQTCQDPHAYNPLSVDQWEFRVMPHRQLLATGQQSAGLAFFNRHAICPVRYSDVAGAVRAARVANERLATAT
jgi:hypothetical protein